MGGCWLTFGRFRMVFSFSLFLVDSGECRALAPDFITANSMIAGLMGAFFLFSGFFISRKVRRHTPICGTPQAHPCFWKCCTVLLYSTSRSKGESAVQCSTVEYGAFLAAGPRYTFCLAHSHTSPSLFVLPCVLYCTVAYSTFPATGPGCTICRSSSIPSRPSS